MEVNYSADIGHLDDPLREAKAEAPDEPLRIRLQLSIFRRGKDDQQRAWKGVAWNVQCDAIDEAVGLREALRAFFEAVVRVGPREVQAALTALNGRAK